MLRRRGELIHLIRLFFHREGFLEVDTPLLSPFLIPESSLEVFRTRYNPAGGEPQELYLIPSPELWMKRLLAEGCASLFQICRCFRNHEPRSPLHEPEFCLLEWYTVGASYLQSIETLERLFCFLFERMALKPSLSFRGRRLDCAPPFRRISMAAAFRSFLNIRLEELASLAAIGRQAQALGVPVSPGDSWADIFHKLFLTHVEPGLPKDRALILYDYPCAIATLAKKKPSGFWAERWELYLAGVETANCYTEATDPRQIEDFFRSQEAAKRQALEPHRIDLQLQRTLQNSFPECSGVALGVDRLAMVLLDQDSVGKVSSFALSDLIEKS